MSKFLLFSPLKLVSSYNFSTVETFKYDDFCELIMNTKLVIGMIGVMAILLLVGGCTSAPEEQPSGAPAITGGVTADTHLDEEAAPAKKAKRTAPETASLTVEITADGFAPESLTVHAGDTVTWLNKHTVHSWPASASHPLHRDYPGSDLAKCSSTERSSIFDACQRLEQGKSFAFTFNEKGSWKYHDHLNPSHTGTIIVE